MAGATNESAKHTEGERQPQYCCSMFGMLALYRVIKNDVNTEHRKLMEHTPFRHLFRALDEERVFALRKKDKCLDDILRTYNQGKGGFKIGSKHYEPTRMDVKLVFGIEDGNIDIDSVREVGREGSEFGPRLFGDLTKITINCVKQKIKARVKIDDGQAREDTVKLLCLILMQTFFFPNTGSNIPWNSFQYVDTFEKMRTYDWSGKIIRNLIQCLRAVWDHPSKVKGCTVFVMYWLCEHCDGVKDRIEEVNRGRAGVENLTTLAVGMKAIPRISKWRLTDVESVVSKADLVSDERMGFNPEELTPTTEEMLYIEGLAEEIDEIEYLEYEAANNGQAIDKAENEGMALVPPPMFTVSDEQKAEFEPQSKGKEVLVYNNTDVEKDWGGPSFSLCLTQMMAEPLQDDGIDKQLGWDDGNTDTVHNAMSSNMLTCIDGGRNIQAGSETQVAQKTDMAEKNQGVEIRNESKGMEHDMEIAEVHKQMKTMRDQMLELKREKTLSLRRAIELEKENKQVLESLDNAVAQMTAMMDDADNLRASKARLAQALEHSEKQVREMKQLLKMQRNGTEMEMKVKVLEGKQAAGSTNDRPAALEQQGNEKTIGRGTDVEELAEAMKADRKITENKLRNQAVILAALARKVELLEEAAKEQQALSKESVTRSNEDGSMSVGVAVINSEGIITGENSRSVDQPSLTDRVKEGRVRKRVEDVNYDYSMGTKTRSKGAGGKKNL